MRDMLKVQELMDICLDQRDKELCQLQSQSQADGAQLTALSLQIQELISLVEARAEVVGRDLGEIVRKLDLSHLCFSLNFYSLMFPRNFLLCFPC